MSDQEDAPKPEENASGSKDANANADAKEMLNKGVDSFKKLDLNGQIYLISLAVVVICVLFFKAYSISQEVSGPAAAFVGEKVKGGWTAFAWGWGKIACLGALAGIGIFIWNMLAAKKEAWVPLALVGCAGLAALMLLIILFQAGGNNVQYAGFKHKAGLTLLGFWLPFLAAIAATAVSVKNILKA